MRRIGVVVLALVVLGGCESIGDLFGKLDDKRLPGTRLSVLLHSRTLSPDPGAAGTEILLPAPVANRDWPQAGGYADHAMHHIAVGASLRRAWKSSAGEGSDDLERVIASPIVAAGRVFTMDAESTVFAFDAKTGREIWETELTPDDEDDGHIAGGLSYSDGRVFATTGFAEVIALKAADGAELWRRRVSGPLRSPPTSRGGRVFVVTIDNKLAALDAATGKKLWDHEGLPETASLLGGSSPAVGGGVIVVPYTSGELVALRAESGRVLWTDSLTSVRRTDVLSTLAHIRGRPIIDRGRVFAISHGGLMVSIDMRTGRRIWEKEIGGAESPWIAGSYLFVVTNDAEVVCVSRVDGRILWVRALPRFEDEDEKEDPITWNGPLLISDRLLVSGSHGEVLTLSPYSGRILGKEEMPDGIVVPPVVANGTVYFFSDDAELIAYR